MYLIIVTLLHMLLHAAHLLTVHAGVIHYPPTHSSDRAGIVKGAYYIELTSPPGTEQADLEQQAFFAHAAEAALRGDWKIRKRYQFNMVTNAVSVDLIYGDITSLAKLPMVRDIWPILTYNRPHATITSTHHPSLSRRQHDPDLVDGLQGIPNLPRKADYTGKGVLVGVIDTGVDYTHPALGGCFGHGCKVSHGYDFVGDHYNGYNTPVPDDDPQDQCRGHGTHVAGIIAANSSTFSGVAPNAQIGAYRVFGCSGGLAMDVLNEALTRAFNDGMHLVNLSLGIGIFWPDYPSAKITNAFVKRGMFVVASAGNDGASGLFHLVSPATAPDVIAVASFDSGGYNAYYFTLASAPDVNYDYAYAKGIPTSLDNATVVTLATNTENAYGEKICSPVSQSLADKVLLAPRGECDFITKAIHAQNAGAIGIIIFNDVPGLDTMIGESNQVKIPIVTISAESGLALIKEINALNAAGKAARILLSTERREFPNTNAYKPAESSSWGTTSTLDVKPDVAAMGGHIYSTYPMNMGRWATLSGTSMAAPYIAANVAQLIERYHLVRSDTVMGDIRNYILNSAVPTSMNRTDNSAEIIGLQPVARQGAGLIDPSRLTNERVMANPSKISWLSHGAKTHQFILGIINLYHSKQTYTVSYEPALTVTNWKNGQKIPITYSKVGGSISISPSVHTIEHRASAQCHIIYTAPEDGALDANEFWLISGYIKVASTTDPDNYAMVPFQTYYGTIKAIPILDRKTPPSLANAMDGDILYITIQFRITSPATRVLLMIYKDGETDKRNYLGVTPGGAYRYLEPSDYAYEVGWDGYVYDIDQNYEPISSEPRRLADGVYRLRIFTSRPFSDLTDLESYDVWQSDRIYVTQQGATLTQPTTLNVTSNTTNT